MSRKIDKNSTVSKFVKLSEKDKKRFPASDLPCCPRSTFLQMLRNDPSPTLMSNLTSANSYNGTTTCFCSGKDGDGKMGRLQNPSSTVESVAINHG